MLCFQSKPKILVMGSTGQIGKPVCKYLSACNQYSVLAVTRDTSTDKAKKVAALPNVSMVKVNVRDPKAFEAVFEREKPYGVFLVTANTLTPEDNENEPKEGKFVVDMCIKYGVQHLLYSSMACIAPARALDIATKVKVEAYININYRGYQKPVFTIIRPAFFLDNMLADGMVAATTSKVGYFGWDSNSPVKQCVTYLDDLGPVVTKIFTEGPSVWAGQTIDICSDALTCKEFEQVFSEHNGGRKVEGWEVFPLDLILRANYHLGKGVVPCKDVPLVHDILVYAQWMKHEGMKADMVKLRKMFPSLRTVKEALRHANYVAPENPSSINACDGLLSALGTSRAELMKIQLPKNIEAMAKNGQLI